MRLTARLVHRFAAGRGDMSFSVCVTKWSSGQAFWLPMHSTKRLREIGEQTFGAGLAVGIVCWGLGLFRRSLRLLARQSPPPHSAAPPCPNS